MARVGGETFPKALAQFEARAFDNGADGKPDTPDDIDLGIVGARWSLEEFAATYDDDDIKYVGEIDPWSGRFTPNLDGPNPSRRGSRNNIGDVYAVATFTPEGGGFKDRQAAACTGPSAGYRAAVYAVRAALEAGNEHAGAARSARLRSCRATIPVSRAECGGVCGGRVLAGRARSPGRDHAPGRRADR